MQPEGRLAAAGTLGSMVTHRIPLACIEEVDAEFSRWLATAYYRA